MATGMTPGGSMIWRRSFQSPLQAAFAFLALFCLVGVLLLGGIAWRTRDHLDRIASVVDRTSRFEQASRRLQRLADRSAGGQIPDADALAALRLDLSAAQREPIREETRMRFAELQVMLAEPEGFSADRLERARTLLEDAVAAETGAQRSLLERMHAEVRAEIETAVSLFVALSALGLLGFWMLQRRILRPLEYLRTMFRKLESGDFSPIRVEQIVHPALVPLFENYNRLVGRLEELEDEHRSRAADLESDVRAAAETLLDQQRTLARAERLAALGEMGASLAHELRNPLAGVQMALSNLRGELSDAGLAARIDLANAELERLTRLLTQQLSAARHIPEAPELIDLASVVEELLALLRYQVPDRVHLEARIEEGAKCVLPRDRLRQALLNLILNAVQALGQEPGTVSVAARREDAQLLVEVSDDGPGFPPEMTQGGIQAFVTRRAGGTGLGLAMVRRLALDLSGDVHLENLEPRGARVRLRVPYRDA